MKRLTDTKREREEIILEPVSVRTCGITVVVVVVTGLVVTIRVSSQGKRSYTVGVTEVG